MPILGKDTTQRKK